jgi:hypothetical protein
VEAGADAKLIQHGPLGVAYHCRHPISTIPVPRITAHATVPGTQKKFLCYLFHSHPKGLSKNNNNDNSNLLKGFFDAYFIYIPGDLTISPTTTSANNKQ